MSSWSGREIIGIIAWIPKLSTLELLAAGDGSMASTITWWEESTLNRQSWEGVLVEGSAEICMCWEVSLLTEKDSAPSDCPQYCLEDSMYYQKMIGWCCPLAFRPFLRYVVLICDTHMVCVWPSIVLFLPLFILLWSRKIIVRQQGSLSGSRPCLRNCQSCGRRRSLPYQIERGSNLFLTEIPPLRKFRLTLGIDSEKTFAPPARVTFVRALIAVVATVRK